MILANMEFPQKLQRQVKGVDPSSEFLSENLASTNSFRETLLSSAITNDFSRSETFEGLANINISAREEQLADRFDMTGVLGHSHSISNAHKVFADYQSSIDGLTYPSIDQDIDQKVESQLDIDSQNHLKLYQSTERVDRSSEKRKITPLKNVRGKKPFPALNEVNIKSQNHNMDLSHLLDADGAQHTSSFSGEISDGTNEVLRSSVKTPIQSLLSTASSHAHSNQLLVALQSLENGLRLYARVQNMSSQEQAELLVNARALLIENGFFEAEIVIDEFRPSATQNNGRGEK